MENNILEEVYKHHRSKIEILYEDTFDLYSMEEVEDEEMHTSENVLVLKYEDIKCRISQRALATNNQTDVANPISYETKIFTSPNITISQGDKLIVNRSGVERKYTSGESFIYVTHQEVSIQRKEWS